MKVLLLTTHMNTGGIGVFTVNLARYLKKEGVDVTVASAGGDLEGALAKDRVPHFMLDIKTKSEFGIKMWKALPVLTRLVRDEGFQLLHAQTRVAQVLAAVSGKITSVPFVSTGHGFYKHRRLSRRLFPCWGEKVIAISSSVRRHLVEDFHVQPERVALIYTGIELDRYLSESEAKDHDLMRTIGLAEDALVVGAISRLSSVKGLKYLVSAFKDAATCDGNMRLLIVGEGPEKDALEKQILALGIADKVFMTAGSVPLERYLSLIDVFCLPSVHEGLGLSLMEAMAAGRACIASDVGGPSELIAHQENGILVPPEDPDSLSVAILRLAEDAGLRRQLGKGARKKASGFSIKRSVAQTMGVYREVLGIGDNE
ncbi:MAG: glycosyltransferase family 4 protein [Candidatus Omnitrophota bacterium]